MFTESARVLDCMSLAQMRRLTLDVASRVARIRASYKEGESWGIIDAVMGPAQT